MGVRLTSWNLLHGMAIPPASLRDGRNVNGENLAGAMQKLDAQIHSDIYGFQEVDHFLPRSSSRPQMRDIAEALGARDWAMAPSIIGTPGEKWRKLGRDEPEIITNKSSHQELMHESYGIGIVSKVPVISWHRLNLGNSPIGMPLVVPGDETGKGRPRFIYVRDEPRVAIAAVLENGWVDTFRYLNPDVTGGYSWWSQRFPSVRLQNKGWRIDYCLVSEPLKNRIKRALILPEAKHSDHCPILVEIE